MNKAHGAMVTCSVLASSCDPNALVRPTPAGTNRAYAKIIIQPAGLVMASNHVAPSPARSAASCPGWLRSAMPACPRPFSLDVIKVAQDHRTAHRLEKCGSGHGQYRDA